jgi:hypothetical protein
VPITLNNIVGTTRLSLTDWPIMPVHDHANALLDDSPYLTDTIKLMPTDRLVYLPMVLK